jgi:hypothetical protein
MIGGGGGGGGAGGEGGGTGACLVAFNQSITAGNYTFVVGDGGSFIGNTSGNPGYDTFLGNNLYKERGGGGGFADVVNGIIGGCSGGTSGGINNVAYTSPTPATDNIFNGNNSAPVVKHTLRYGISGNKGGDVTDVTSYSVINYGGGGGIGSAAANANSTTKSTTGGDGLYQVID